MIALVAQRVLEHLADAGHLVLPVQREDHREERVELRAFHHLRDAEDRLRKLLLVRRDREIDPHFQLRHLPRDVGVLFLHTRDVAELRRHLVEIDIERADDVQQRIHVDGLLRDVPQRRVLQLGRREIILDDVQHRVAHDALRRGKIAHAHLDDPPLLRRKRARIPLLRIARHVDHVRLPVVRLHLLIDAVGLVVFQRQDVQLRAAHAIDHALPREPRTRLRLVEAERFRPHLIHHKIALLAHGEIGVGKKERVVRGGRGGCFEAGSGHGGLGFRKMGVRHHAQVFFERRQRTKKPAGSISRTMRKTEGFKANRPWAAVRGKKSVSIPSGHWRDR